MKLADRIKSAYKVFTSQNLGNSVTGQVLRNYQTGSKFDPTRQLTGITYKAIDKIGLSLSVYQPEIKRKNGETYINHPLLTLIKYPNPIQKNGSDFIHLYAMLYEIYGETFWYLARGENTRKIKELYLLNPAQMELVIQEGELLGYILHKASGDQVPLTLDEVYHDKRPNPFNEWRGMSVMEKASVYIDTEITTSVFTLNYMKNNASPSGIVSLPDMDRETFKQFAMQWREGYEGPENAGKTAFIRGGQAEFKAVGATLKDVDQEITRKMAKDDVLMMLEVPKELLGMTNSTGFGRNTVEAFSYIFSKEKIEPMMIRLDRIIANINEMQPGGEVIEVTHKSSVQEDKDFVHKQNKDLVNVALTINEVRARMNLPPIKGGDELQPKNQPDKPLQVEEVKSTKVVLKKKLSKVEQLKKAEEDKENFRLKLMETNDLYTKKIKSTIGRFAQEQEDSIIEKINATSKSFEEWLFSVKEDSVELAILLAPLLIELMMEQSKDVSNFISGEALQITPEIKKLVENNALKISGLFNQDTITALEKTILEGQQKGESLAKLKKRVEQTYSDAKGYRAERIARTEGLRATNRSAELVYSQSGYSQVEWFVNPGACQFCLVYAGRTKTIGTNFINLGDVITGSDGGIMRIEYDNIDVPPLHPNCNCSLVPSGKNLAEDL
jgi:HK97 family phage portal protein